jgi:hypothetical protein
VRHKPLPTGSNGRELSWLAVAERLGDTEEIDREGFFKRKQIASKLVRFGLKLKASQRATIADCIIASLRRGDVDRENVRDVYSSAYRSPIMIQIKRGSIYVYWG